MNLPPGHKMQHSPNIICRLKKSFFGKLNNFLTSYNFKVSNVDNSLFIKIINKNIIVILVYVDNIIITGNDSIEINCIKKDLKEKN
jgi:Reverse transcriptase (RNA-dependent DNA polymerase)